MKFLRKIKDKIIFFRIRRLKHNFQMKIIENLNEQNFKSFIQKNPNFNLKKEIDNFCSYCFLCICLFKTKNKFDNKNFDFYYQKRQNFRIKIQFFSNLENIDFDEFDKKFIELFFRTGIAKFLHPKIRNEDSKILEVFRILAKNLWRKIPF